MRRLVISIVVGLALVSGATVAAAAPEYSWKGTVKTTYIKAGGEKKFGKATSSQKKIVVSKRNTYHQHAQKGDAYSTIFWSKHLGGKTWTTPKIPNLNGVNNERNALSRYGFEPVLYRSAKLCGATRGARQLMSTMLHGGMIIDLRGSGPAKKCPDPNLPGVKEVRISISHHADYPRYVTGKTEKAQFAKAITAFANEPDPVLVHCTMGQDRTGWFVAMVMFAGGATEAEVFEEFNRTPNPPTQKLTAGLAKIKSEYGSVENYLRTGLGLTDATLQKINAKKID